MQLLCTHIFYETLARVYSRVPSIHTQTRVCIINVGSNERDNSVLYDNNMCEYYMIVLVGIANVERIYMRTYIAAC